MNGKEALKEYRKQQIGVNVYADELLDIIEKELEILKILKAFDFEIEDYTEDLNGSVCVKQRRIILDDEEIDLIKEWLERW